MPNYLVDVEAVKLETEIFGQKLDLPFFLSPTGMNRLFHHEKELAVARVADSFGTLYSLSTVATSSIEEISAAIDGPKMFQIYIHKDEGLTREFVQRSKDSGFAALCLTVDVPTAGNRERELFYGMSMPPKLRYGNIIDFLKHPTWTSKLFMHPDFKLANVVARKDVIGKGVISLMDYFNTQLIPNVTWDHAQWLIEEWGGPFAIKGLLTKEDAIKAKNIGASAVMISNHGGRQLDSTPAPVDCVAEIRDAVGDDLELIVDGGIRRGTDVLKALALGANAVSIGRAYLFGLAAGGEFGVLRALSLLKDEVARGMALLGTPTVKDIGSKHVRLSKTSVKS
jgi:L-lactate dehydrogenase (cytochrome)